MNDDPSDVHVLYAKVVEKDNILQQLVDNALNFFSPTGKPFVTFTRNCIFIITVFCTFHSTFFSKV